MFYLEEIYIIHIINPVLEVRRCPVTISLELTTHQTQNNGRKEQIFSLYDICLMDIVFYRMPLEGIA